MNEIKSASFLLLDWNLASLCVNKKNLQTKDEKVFLLFSQDFDSFFLLLLPLSFYPSQTNKCMKIFAYTQMKGATISSKKWNFEISSIGDNSSICPLVTLKKNTWHFSEPPPLPPPMWHFSLKTTVSKTFI